MLRPLLLIIVLSLAFAQDAQLCPSDTGLVAAARLTFSSSGNPTNTIPA